MARIKIKDLPKDTKISKEELKRVKGGATYYSPSTILSAHKLIGTSDQAYINLDSSLREWKW